MLLLLLRNNLKYFLIKRRHYLYGRNILFHSHVNNFIRLVSFSAFKHKFLLPTFTGNYFHTRGNRIGYLALLTAFCFERKHGEKEIVKLSEN